MPKSAPGSSCSVFLPCHVGNEHLSYIYISGLLIILMPRFCKTSHQWRVRVLEWFFQLLETSEYLGIIMVVSHSWSPVEIDWSNTLTQSRENQIKLLRVVSSQVSSISMNTNSKTYYILTRMFGSSVAKTWCFDSIKLRFKDFFNGSLKI